MSKENPETLADFIQILTDSGYRQFDSRSAYPSATAFYQKRIADDRGTLFFVNCCLYEQPELYQCVGVEIDTYFRGKNAAYTIQEYAKDDFELNTTEELFITLWKAGKFEYSEVND